MRETWEQFLSVQSPQNFFFFNVLVYFDWNCCEKQSRKKTSECKILPRKLSRIAEKLCKSKKSSEHVRKKKKKRYLEEQTKVQAGYTVAGKPASGDGKSLREIFSWITIDILVTSS